MKTKIYVLGIFVLFFSVAVSAKMKDGQAITGNSLTGLGKYTIVYSESPMQAGNQELVTFDLFYENASNPVKIGIIKEKKCTTYLVRSDEFEVQYTCRKNVFGVKKMDKKYRQLDDAVYDAKLNRVSFFAQRVISQSPKTNEELLGLIACYFPNLVEEQYHSRL